MSRQPIDKTKVPVALWSALQRAGLSPAAVLRQARLPATLHLSDPSYVSTEQFFALWDAVAELSQDDPTIGLKLVQVTDPSLHPPPILSALYARDYRDALERIARFKQLCTPEEMRIVESGDTTTISSSWIFASRAEPAVAADVTLSTLLELGRRGTGHHIQPIRVDLARPRAAASQYRSYFQSEVRFSVQQSALVLRTSDLARPFAAHNPEMLAIVTPALAAALEELKASSSIGQQIKTLLKRRMASGRPDLTDIARELGMSERTLQRRVTDEGLTFRQLLLEARQELGRQLLSGSAADVDEIAYLLGYQDTTSFYRAFRSWEGVTPNRWRAMKGEPAGAGSIH